MLHEKNQYVQTDNRFKLTNRFSDSKQNIPMLFENTAVPSGLTNANSSILYPRDNSEVRHRQREV